MVAITSSIAPPHSTGQLRPFDVRRDLNQVADLVEEAFADTLDPDGQNYLRQMRAAAGNPGYLRWATAVTERVSLPLSGYVWEEDGRVVGNLTLIPFLTGTQRCYLIANVAVYPAYRRRGIARQLTARAVEHARERNAPAVWLHVRAENTGAIRLYESLGFNERARRTTWHAHRLEGGAPHLAAPDPEAEELRRAASQVTVGLRRSTHWELQYQWLRQIYPPELTWHLSIRPSSLRPGLGGIFQRFFTNSSVQQWSASSGGRLLGVLARQSAWSFADTLWLAAPPESEDVAAYSLLAHARRHLPAHRALALDYPAGHANTAIRAAGFHLHQTLIWMAISFR